MLKSPISEIVPLGLSIKIVELGKLIETNQAQEAWDHYYKIGMRKGLIFLSTLLTCYTLFSQSKCEDLVNFQRSEYAAFLIDTIYFCEPETQLGDSNSIVETLSRHNFPIDSSKSIQSDEALSLALNFIHDTFGVSLEDSFYTVIGGYFFLKNDYSYML